MMWKYLWVTILVLMMVGCAAHAVTSGRVVIRDDRAQSDVRFSDHDRAAIEQYYRSAKPKKMPPGLARRDTLPPGLQGRALPRELEARLAVLPAAQARVIIGRDIVLMQRDTRVVLDILYGIAD
jgi:hypothetical protein